MQVVSLLHVFSPDALAACLSIKHVSLVDRTGQTTSLALLLGICCRVPDGFVCLESAYTGKHLLLVHCRLDCDGVPQTGLRRSKP